MKSKFPNAHSYVDVRGKIRWRHRKTGKDIQLGTAFGSDDFIRRYEAAEQGIKIRRMVGADRVKHGTVNDLCARFYQTGEYRKLAASTQRQYRGIIERFRAEHGTKTVAGIKPHHVQSLIDKKLDTPTAANTFRKRLSQLLDLATRLEWIPSNPVKQTKSFVTESGGIYAWTEDDIAKFFAFHQAGTTAHLAVTLMLYTGAAKVDAVKLGPFSIKQSENGRRIEYKRQKTLRTNGQLVSIPIHPDLEAVIAACPDGTGTFLQTAFGQKRSAEGLGNAMRDWCDQVGLTPCSSHGLRKACARRLAEAGATARQIASVTGHKTLSEVQRYIESANRETMADQAFVKLLDRPNHEQKVVNMPKVFTKKSTKQLNTKE
jgi:site-specific recombinase XerD